MTRLIKLKSFSLILLVITLTGCATTEQIEETPKVDLFELKAQADAAYLADDLEASERDYQVLVEELPEEAIHWFRLGNIYVRTNRPSAAVNLYREAVLRNPEYGKAWYNLSIVQLKQTAYSLNEMLLYTDISDPLHNKAQKMLQGIQSIIKQD